MRVRHYDDVSLEVKRGEFVFLVGKSGSGKSTFLQLTMREIRATSGTVWVLGHDVGKLSRWSVPKLRRQVGTVFQDFRLLPLEERLRKTLRWLCK